MTGSRPDLSILMVNWNTREMTLACLRSIYAEAPTTSFEIILVDNGSQDGSAQAIASAFPQVKLIAETRNHGFARANNIAAEKARGQYLLLLNTDTLILDDAIDRLVNAARAFPQALIWGGRTLFGDGQINPSSVWGRITGWSAVCFALGLRSLFRGSALFNSEGLGDWQRDSIRSVDIVSGCFFLIPRAFWARLGGFDPKFFMYGEEADLCARARALGARPMMTPDARIIHYGGASAASQATKIAYVMGARMGLIDRHLSGLERQIGRAATLMHVVLRAGAFRIAAWLYPTRFGPAAREWGLAWAQRAHWVHGPSPVELTRQT
jgi:GT2 family glycosyltransferase